MVLLVTSPGAFDQARADESWIALPQNAQTIGILRDGESYLGLSFVGWGPKWQYLGFRGNITESGGESRLTSSAKVRASGATVTFDAIAQKVGPKELKIVVAAQTDRDTDLTYLVGSLEVSPKDFTGGAAFVESVGAVKKKVKMPLGRKGLGEHVSRFTLVDARGRPTVFTLDPPCDVGSDGAARIILAGTRLQASRPRQVAITVHLPEDVVYFTGPRGMPAERGSGQWYPFRPSQNYDQPTELDMTDWIEAPAGRHGRIRRLDDRLIYDGKPIKLWGINVCYASCAPDHELAEKRAQFYSRYGINSVRLHKWADGFGWAGIQSRDSFAEFDPEALERMDYFVAQLKKRGIYVELSAHFGSLKLGPADVRDVPYMNEFGKLDRGKNRVTAPHSGFFYSPELQQLHIRQAVNLLKHRNPYTGLTYAQDPVIAFLEIINEQSILFYTSTAPLKTSATIRKYAAGRFSDWLAAKYGSQQGLLKAWGKKSLDSFESEGFSAGGERLEKRNILPVGNPWFWDPENLNSSQLFRRQRLLDTLEFLYTLQCEAYDRYVKAVQSVGYEGEIVGSNWQAGRAFSHYYNLYSDARVGLIDRHNYFGGGGGGKIDNVTMLRVPGSGMLSAGMQQVAGRPFMLSEWIHVEPNEWGVEGPAIIGAYGMGLQGWDVSYMFQNRDNGGFAEEIGKGRWVVTAPQVLGVFPAVARQVLRGDVVESDVRASRNVHLPSLREGKLDFNDQTKQEYDVKSFDCDKVPAQTLAVARTVVTFTNTPQSTRPFNLEPYRRGNALVSSTGQLKWTPGKRKLDGFFTIDSAGTKAVVGFAQGQSCKLGDITLTPQSRFAAIYVVAQERDRDLSSSKNLLVVAMARARNTGMKVLNDSVLVDPGKPPIVLEPVKATISIRRPGNASVYLLDHDGRRTGKTLRMSDGTIEIDGARDRTPYYLIHYKS